MGKSAELMRRSGSARGIPRRRGRNDNVSRLVYRREVDLAKRAGR